MHTLDRHNFCGYFKKLESLICKAAFVGKFLISLDVTIYFSAIDFEFFGLPQHLKSGFEPSISESPTERYGKLAASIKTYPPCQMGLSIFIESNEGKTFTVHSYRMYLFKQTIPDNGSQSNLPSFSYPSLAFLKDHNLDFNEWIKNGINFCNADELEKYKQMLSSDFPDFSFLGDSFLSKLETLRAELNFNLALSSAEVLTSSSSSSASSPSATPHVVHSPSIASMAGISSDSDSSYGLTYSFYLTGSTTQHSYQQESRHALWTEQLSPIEMNAVLYDLTSRFPRYTFKIDDGKKLKISQVQSSSGYDQRVSLALDTLLSSIFGVSRIMQTLSNVANIPIVMHNASLDILYLQEYFVKHLPSKYEAAKNLINFTFPCIIDTKFMSMLCNSFVKVKGGTKLNSFDLEQLKRYFDSRSNSVYSPNVAFPSPELTNSLKKCQSNFHDAGHDSMITGEMFIKLAACFILNSQSTQKRPTPTRFREVLYLIRPSVANRIPLPFISTPFINLAGQDPSPFDLYHIILRKKQVRFDAMNGGGNGSSCFIVNWVKNHFLKIGKEDLDMVKEYIRAKLGAIGAGNKSRFDIKLNKDGSRIELCCINHDV
uniref:Ribonuclease CAF1 n=1 Tax=Rhabditophanes sp. KR3021 TaxID=114890 RepID=A0AC35UFJ9_9BILA